eukprot:8702938-Pyramimonas_sp.AAC.2
MCPTGNLRARWTSVQKTSCLGCEHFDWAGLVACCQHVSKCGARKSTFRGRVGARLRPQRDTPE